MSSTQEDSQVEKRCSKKSDKGRRIWTPNEEAILIAAVKELIANGWKSDNGFRAGYLNKLEEAMRHHYPSTDLRATPHINSKMQTWKKLYYSLRNILGYSGLAMSTNHKIDCEDDIWDSIVKADPSARQMRHKSWPYYDSWKDIFGKDRATGDSAEDIFEAYTDLRSSAAETENEDIGGDYFVNLDGIGEPEYAAESNSNRPQRVEHPQKPAKKSKASEAISGVCDILVEIGRKADARLASLAESLGYEARLGKVLEDAFDELGTIPELSDEERFEVCGILGTQADKLKIFKGMPAAKKPQYVAWLLTKFHN